jgi:D-beta-D-heptose 7-phosphate kinase/D-beta-D-heptose 1-phosphate adenosyltransferase
VLVIGDIMLDQFLWGRVSRISPEAPVPVVEFERESFMPGGAANVARNLAALGVKVELFGLTGRDQAAAQLEALLTSAGVGCSGVTAVAGRMTTRKVRVVAQQQQLLRVDREAQGGDPQPALQRLVQRVERALNRADAVIVADYAKGVVTQEVLDRVRVACRSRGVWLSLDPKPSHQLELSGLSLITPNRKELFELAQCSDGGRASEPLNDSALIAASESLMTRLRPALLLVTLGEHGMLLCQRTEPARHISTIAREVFDVSGAGDTVIASFTLAIAAGASPSEAAVFSNHAAGVVVGKVGTAVVSPTELLNSLQAG